jgi:beta-N-acetylhexosaminidase
VSRNRAAPALVASFGLLTITLGSCQASPAEPAEGSITSSTGQTSPTTSPASSPASPVGPDQATLVLRRMSLAQRAGQLVMVGAPATGSVAAAARAVSRHHVGNVMLTGRSRSGVRATARVSARLQAGTTEAATADVPLLVATDQEGGAVQVLAGPGFSPIPAARTQGTWGRSTLRPRAARWGRQLRAAGVQLNLAPVADVVPTSEAAGNAPIGAYGRQFGPDPDDVADHAGAFAAGMGEANVLAVAKHFPGLGRVTANTDTAASVVDRVTTDDSGSVAAFAALIADDVPVVMIASATYRRIDPENLACFSSVVITDLLRRRLGFGGLVISDDLGQARQVAAWRPGSRAVKFIAAGGDLVLTVDPSLAPAMAEAVADRARRDPTFRRQTDAAALRVLRAKAAAGLL